MGVLLVMGTRPEAIKLAPVYRAFQANGLADVRVCVTAQHREMLDSVLRTFDITPDFDLDLMRPNQDLTDLTARALPALRDVYATVRPDTIVVQGDTTTAFAAALQAHYLGIPVAHVEAGLRTGNSHNPFPEEMNRRLCDTLSTHLFAPTELARDNLLHEGIDPNRIHVVGNTVIDAMLQVARGVAELPSPPEIDPSLATQLAVWTKNGRAVLVTGHRRESFGDGIRNISLALRDLADHNPDIEIIYPVHLNPNVAGPVNQILGDTERVHLIDPLPYRAFVWLMQRSHLVLTDSGGIQEEAPSLGRPVLVMRDTTERPEAIEAGTARLVGTNRETIVAEAQHLLDNADAYDLMARIANPYGDGKASGRIVDTLAMERAL